MLLASDLEDFLDDDEDNYEEEDGRFDEDEEEKDWDDDDDWKDEEEEKKEKQREAAARKLAKTKKKNSTKSSSTKKRSPTSSQPTANSMQLVQTAHIAPPEIIQAGSMAFGFDEGLVFRYGVTEALYLGASVGFLAQTPDTIHHILTYSLWFKGAAWYSIFSAYPFTLRAFAEGGALVEALESDVWDPSGSTLRYYRWSPFGRIGISPEVHIGARLSLAYKIGVEAILHGTDYSLNSSGELTSSENGYTGAALSGAGSALGNFGMGSGEKSLFMHNIALYFRIPGKSARSNKQ